MTGLFVRLKRDGADGPSRPVDIDEMTDAELDALDDLMDARDAGMNWEWAKVLARWIRDHRAQEERDDARL